MTEGYLFFDIESHSADKLWDMPAEEFVRTFQYAWNDGPVAITTDLEKARELLRSARFIIGHNIHSFDLTAIFGKDSIEPLEMALSNRVIDTMCVASLVNPAPYSYENKDGHTVYDAAKPERAMRWFSLDEQAHQLGVPGKAGDISELAARFNPPKTAKSKLDYSLIPVDDEDFVAYAKQDVETNRSVYLKLMAMLKEQKYPGDYVWRENLLWAITAQITRNGIVVDTDAADKRIEQLLIERDEMMAWLVEKYEFPTEGKSPWASTAGKEAILKALADYGITERTHPEWPRTPTGSLKLGGEDLIALTENTEAEAFGKALAILKGQRSLAQLALDSMHSDGRVHPSITSFQRSGRWSVTKPGLTIFGARTEELSVDKSVFVPAEGNLFVELDFAAADARAVAALSGDPEFAKRFEPGVDSHDLTGEIFYGIDAYHAKRDELRPIAKMGGHALAYRIGARKLATSVNVSFEEAKRFISNYQQKYRWVHAWQEKVTRDGDSGWVTNTWGRRMRVDPDRSYTQSSALHGQSTTREAMGDALIRIVKRGPRFARALRAIIHDALLAEFPEATVTEDSKVIQECMEFTFSPGGVGQDVYFPVSIGNPASDWAKAAHG